ncbi:MAG: hypothetical protein ACE5I1_05415 [bacterium]
MNKNLFNLAKLPIFVAAGVVVIRLILELAGVTGWLPQVFGVAWLDILVPIYLALKIADGGFDKPFLSIIKAMLMYAIPARVMVAITYILAYALEWRTARFALVIPENATPLQGYLTIPATGVGFGILSALVGAAVFGGLTLLIKQRMAKPETA